MFFFGFKTTKQNMFYAKKLSTAIFCFYFML